MQYAPRVDRCEARRRVEHELPRRTRVNRAAPPPQPVSEGAEPPLHDDVMRRAERRAAAHGAGYDVRPPPDDPEQRQQPRVPQRRHHAQLVDRLADGVLPPRRRVDGVGAEHEGPHSGVADEGQHLHDHGRNQIRPHQITSKNQIVSVSKMKPRWRP